MQNAAKNATTKGKKTIQTPSVYILWEPKLYQTQGAVNCIWIDSEIDLPASGRLWKVSVMCGCLPVFTLDITYSRHLVQKRTDTGNRSKSRNKMI